MGLKLLPELDAIYLFKKGKVDAWGISSIGESKEEVTCYIKETEASTSIESKGGKMVIPSYDIGFNGDVPINVGDCIEVYGVKKVVLMKSQKKDLSRTVLITKITV